MKILLILCAIALAECDKLDRTYLPPRGSLSAGGSSEDLNLPVEFPRENYPSELDFGDDGVADGSLISKYPNIALGIDRKGPPVTSPSNVFSNRSGVPIMENIYSIPTTTSYDLIETSSFSPVETYDSTVGPITTITQGYSSTSTPFKPNLSYDQYLIQQNIKQKDSLPRISSLVSRDPVTFLSNKNVGFTSNSELSPGNNQQFEKNPVLDNNVNEYISGQPSEYGAPESQLTNLPSKLTKTTLIPDETFVGESVADMGIPSTKYPSTPIPNNFGTRYNTNDQPKRIQADNDRNAVIVNFENILTPDGFAYSFDTSNGIHADESGTAIDGVKAKGSYSFTGDDGKIYSIEYTADENGFLPRGNHLPTAPPIPSAILKGIEQAEKNKELGIVDDGSYDDDKYGHQRYQGLMDYIPQSQYNGIISRQPGLKKNEQRGETTIFENIKPANNVNNGEGLSKTSASYTPGTVSISPNTSKTIEVFKNDPYLVKDDKDLLTYSGAKKLPENRLFNTKVESVNNNPINEPRNNVRGGNKSNVSRVNQTLLPGNVNQFEQFDPLDYSRNLAKDYDAQKVNNYDLGYEYTKPQNMFNDNDKNRLQSIFPTIRQNDETNLDDERIKAKDFITPNLSFNPRNQEPVTNSRVFGKRINEPVTIPAFTNSINTQNANEGINPGAPTFYNRGLNPIKKEDVTPERVFSTFKPRYTTTTIKPYNYQSQTSKYPSSTMGSQYSVSTTPLPSVNTSPFTPTTSTYSRTTPTGFPGISTTKLPITSGRPTSGIPSRPPAYTETISGQVEDSRISTLKPNTFGQRVTGRPGYQGRPNKTPIIKAEFSEDFIPGFVVSADPRSSLRITSAPENFRSQTSIGKMIGEDFSGPKQAQRFDPEYGYYY